MENLDFAVQVMVVGFSMVLFTLFVLYLIILLLGFLLAPKAVSLSREPLVFESISLDSLPGKKIAVITAAVYAFLEDCPDNYIIKNIEPIKNPYMNRWSYEGRKNLLKMNSEIEKIRREQSGKKVF